MPASSITLSAGGELVVIRRSPPENRDRLARTAATMRAATGIAVDVLDVDDGPPLVVTLAYGGRVPDAPMVGAAAAALGAKVAVAVSDLHELGLVHGAIELEHVLVDVAGAVRLCGFGASGPGDGSVDVRALGSLLDALVDPGDRSEEASAVRAVAARTRSTDAPTAAALAASLASIGGPPRVAAPPARDRPSMRRDWLGDKRVIAGALTAVVAVIALVATASSDDTGAARRVAAPTTSAHDTSTSTTAVEAHRVWPTTPMTVQGAGATWQLGEEGDTVVVGAWACAGEATPVLVRADGTVWLVERWADGLPASYVTTIDDDVVSVRVEPRADGCDDLVITTPSATLRPLS